MYVFYIISVNYSKIMKLFRNVIPNIASKIYFLQTESSFMTFEGLQIQGSIKIMEKLTVSINLKASMII